jgi:probable F420-dependent oxidoreductase
MVADPGQLKFGLAVVGQPFMGYAEAQQLLDVARYLDGSRFDAMFYVDHLFLEGDRYLALPRDVQRPYQLECYTTLASIAAVTKRLRVGPSVTPIPLRHPSFVAKMAATIDVISGGRFILGVGTGWNRREYAAYSHDYLESPRDRFDKFLEGLEVVRALFETDGLVNYEGRHYRLEGAPFYPKPVQKPGPPIWIGGASKRTLRAVASLGDGWCPAAPHYNAVSPEVYAAGLADIRRQAAENGRDPESIMTAVILYTSIAESHDEAMQLAEAQHLRDDWKEIPLEDMQKSGVLVAGTPSECAAHLLRYVEAGVRYPIVCPVPFTMENTANAARLYSEQVIPELVSEVGAHLG